MRPIMRPKIDPHSSPHSSLNSSQNSTPIRPSLVWLLALFFILVLVVLVLTPRPAAGREGIIEFRSPRGASLTAFVFEPDNLRADNPGILLLEDVKPEGFKLSTHQAPHRLEPFSLPRLQIARHLKERGYVVLTYSPRGFASNLNVENLQPGTFAVHVEDAKAAYLALAGRNAVDENRLTVIVQGYDPPIATTLKAQITSELERKRHPVGVIAFSPKDLYRAPALSIRELARRSGEYPPISPQLLSGLDSALAKLERNRIQEKGFQP
jgi:hypothetical protein